MARFDITGLLDPQMAAAMAKSAELTPTQGTDVSVETMRRLYLQERAYWNADRPEVAASHDFTLPGPVCDIPLRIHYPSDQRPLPGLVFLHGGGWILGNLESHDKIMRRLALEAGVAVIGVDYSLAPEQKFPTQIEEAVTAVQALAARAGEWGLDPAQLAIGGDSAGANLSLATLLACKSAGNQPLQAGLLYYGAFGLKDSASRRKFGGAEDGMSADDLAFYKTCLIRTPADLDDPLINLLSQDLTGLPPLFVAAAALDPLLDDSTLLAELLAEAGVAHRLEIYEGVLHGFLHYSRMVDKASRALNDGATWLQSALGR